MKKYRPKTQLGKRLQGDKRHRIIIYAVAGLVINLMYAFYNGILGIMFRSIWFMTLFAYYAVLSSMRFGAVMFERRIAADGGKADELYIMNVITGDAVFLFITALGIRIIISV